MTQIMYESALARHDPSETSSVEERTLAAYGWTDPPYAGVERKSMKKQSAAAMADAWQAVDVIPHPSLERADAKDELRIVSGISHLLFLHELTN